MSDSRRARTFRRLTGGVLLALILGLAIERAGAQQQGSVGANVNVISGTGADGDWTLQRQNEPTLACSSRNPQNCLAGANDYRTVDIPFPDSGEKITGDAWLGWYTSKNGGLTWRTRLLPGYPQDRSAAGLASPLRGYPAGADPIIRAGTNGLFYYGGLVFNREEGEGSAIFVARFIDNNNQEGVSGEPIAYVGASIVHRIGPVPVVARQGRGAPPTTRIASAGEREREERAREERRKRTRARCRDRNAGAMFARARNKAASRWSTSHGWRSTSRARARPCARSVELAPVSRCSRFPAGASTWRTRSSMARRRAWTHHAQLLGQLRRARGARRESSAACRAPTSTMTVSSTTRT